MTLSVAIAALGLVSAMSQAPSGTEAPPSTPVAQSAPVPSREWLVSARILAPTTTTDPKQVVGSLGMVREGAFRMAALYQPSNTGLGRLGVIHVSVGGRVLRRDTWQLSIDGEHSQARPVRRLFRGNGWDLDGHERYQLSIGVASLRWRERRFLGLVDEVELGFGRMHIWRGVSASVGKVTLNSLPAPILDSLAPVGVLGLRAGHRLIFGFEGQAHVRLIGAGHSRGGEVPFAHATIDWQVTRQLFRSKTFGNAFAGVSGNHATSPRAVSYFQNSLGAIFRLAF